MRFTAMTIRAILGVLGFPVFWAGLMTGLRVA